MAVTQQFLARAARAVPLLALGITAACQPASPDLSSAHVQPAYDPATGALVRITYDRNQDGQVDAWLYLSQDIPTRAELDDDFDGAPDRWEHYEAAPPGMPPVQFDGPVPRGLLVRAEQDVRGDGTVSRWESYADGQLSAVEEDTTGDGRPDKWEEWSGGQLVAVALDTRNTGHPDRRIVYGASGTAPRLELDEDGDGQFVPAAAP